MSTPVKIDTPFGPMAAPPGHSERARQLSDEELCEKMNAGGLVDPTALHVALYERPHVKRRPQPAGATRWVVRESSIHVPSEEGKEGKPYTISRVVRSAARLLSRGAKLREEDSRLLTFVSDELEGAGGPVSVSALIEAWVRAGGKRDNWRIYDAVKFLRERGLIHCTGSRGRLAQDVCYAWDAG